MRSLHQIIAITVVLALGAGMTARAADIAWDGDAGNGTWSDPLNWAGDVAPGAGDRAVFSAGSGTVTIAGAVSIAGIETSGTWTGTILQQAPVTLSGSWNVLAGTWDAGAQTISVGGNATIAASAVFLRGTSTVQLTGTGTVSNATPANGFHILACAATGKTTTIADTVCVRGQCQVGPGILDLRGTTASRYLRLIGSGQLLQVTGTLRGWWPHGGQVWYESDSTTPVEVAGGNYGQCAVWLITRGAHLGRFDQQGGLTNVHFFNTLADTAGGTVEWHTNDHDLTCTVYLSLGGGASLGGTVLHAGASQIHAGSNFAWFSNSADVVHLESSQWTVPSWGAWSPAGQVIPGTSTITVKGSSLGVSWRNDITQRFCNLILDGAGVTQHGPLIAEGHVTVANGTWNLNNLPATIAGNLEVTATAGMTLGSQTVSVGGNATFAANAPLTAGTSTVRLTGNGVLAAPTQTFHRLEVAAAGTTVHLGSDVTTRTCAVLGGTFDLRHAGVGRVLHLQGAGDVLTNNGALLGNWSNGGQIWYEALDAQTVNVAGTNYGQCGLRLVSKGGAAAVFSQQGAISNAHFLTTHVDTAGGSVTWTTNDHPVTVTVYLTTGNGGQAQGPTTLNAGASTIHAGHNYAWFTKGGDTIDLGSSQWTVRNWGAWNPAVSILPGTSSVTVRGAQIGVTWRSDVVQIFHDLVLNPVAPATPTAVSGPLQVTGTTTLGAGTLRIPTGTATFAGDVLATAGHVDATGAAIALTATGNQAAAFGAGALAGSLLVQNGNRTVTLGGIAVGTWSVPAATTVAVTAGAEITVSQALTLAGSTTQPVTLGSTAPGTPWNLTVAAGATQAVTEVQVADSDASAGAAIDATQGGVDLGGNTNWVFTATGAPPTVAEAAAAMPNPVTGTTTQVSVLGDDDAGEANLTYAWTATGPTTVTFAASNTNAAKQTTATFAAPGTYTLTATITDGTTQSVTSSVMVQVQQTLTAIQISPTTATVSRNGSQAFLITGQDQFAQGMSAPAPTWSVTGTGSVDTSGLYTAGTDLGQATVTATVGALSTSATVTVANAAPTIATAPQATPATITGTATSLSVLGADDAGEAGLTYAWSVTTGPTGVQFSANGTNAAKTTTATFAVPGSYTFQVLVTDGDAATVTTSAIVDVVATTATVQVAPATATVIVGETQAFTASVLDQFGSIQAGAPVTWTATAGASIDAAGLLTAGATPGAVTVTATSGAVSGTASVTIDPAPNQAPIITAGPSIAQNPVEGVSSTLSVTVADDGGPANLTVTWSRQAGPAEITFAPNGTSGSTAPTATFQAAGAYTIRVTVTDAQGLVTTADLPVTVSATPTTVAVTPATATIFTGGTQAFSATVADQFTDPITSPTVTWSVDALASIDASGLLTAGLTPGAVTVTATSGSVSGTAEVSMQATENQSPTIVANPSANPNPITGTMTHLSVLGQDDGGEPALTYLWTVSGPEGWILSDNGTNAAKECDLSFARPGTYAASVTIQDAHGASVVAEVILVVEEVLSLQVLPHDVILNPGQAQDFQVALADQFGNVLESSTGVWTATGGSIDAQGRYVAGESAGLYAVSALVDGAETLVEEVRINDAPSVVGINFEESPVAATSVVAWGLASDDVNDPSELIWGWSVVGGPEVHFQPEDEPGRVRLAFTQAGTHLIQVRVQDAHGRSTTVTETVEVLQTATVVALGYAIQSNGHRDYDATLRDQFWDLMQTQPSIAWTAVGGGSIDEAGVVTLDGSGQPVEITAVMSGITGKAVWDPGVIPGGGGGGGGAEDPNAPPVIPEVLFSVVGGRTGDGEGILNGEEVIFTNANGVSVLVDTVGGAGDIIGVTIRSTGGESLAETYAPGVDFVPLSQEGRIALRAEVTIERGGAQAIALSQAVVVFRDIKQPKVSIWMPERYLGEDEEVRQLPATIYLNGMDEEKNAETRESGRPVFALNSFSAEVKASDEETGLSGDAGTRVVTTLTALNVDQSLVLNLPATQPDQEVIGDLMGFAELGESISYGADGDGTVLAGWYLARVEVSDRCGNVKSAEFRLWVKTSGSKGGFAAIPYGGWLSDIGRFYAGEVGTTPVYYYQADGDVIRVGITDRADFGLSWGYPGMATDREATQPPTIFTGSLWITPDEPVTAEVTLMDVAGNITVQEPVEISVAIHDVGDPTEDQATLGGSSKGLWFPFSVDLQPWTTGPGIPDDPPVVDDILELYEGFGPHRVGDTWQIDEPLEPIEEGYVDHRRYVFIDGQAAVLSETHEQTTTALGLSLPEAPLGGSVAYIRFDEYDDPIGVGLGGGTIHLASTDVASRDQGPAINDADWLNPYYGGPDFTGGNHFWDAMRNSGFSHQASILYLSSGLSYTQEFCIFPWWTERDPFVGGEHLRPYFFTDVYVRWDELPKQTIHGYGNAPESMGTRMSRPVYMPKPTWRKPTGEERPLSFLVEITESMPKGSEATISIRDGGFSESIAHSGAGEEPELVRKHAPATVLFDEEYPKWMEWLRVGERELNQTYLAGSVDRTDWRLDPIDGREEDIDDSAIPERYQWSRGYPELRPVQVRPDVWTAGSVHDLTVSGEVLAIRFLSQGVNVTMTLADYEAIKESETLPDLLRGKVAIMGMTTREVEMIVEVDEETQPEEPESVTYTVIDSVKVYVSGQLPADTLDVEVLLRPENLDHRYNNVPEYPEDLARTFAGSGSPALHAYPGGSSGYAGLQKAHRFQQAIAVVSRSFRAVDAQGNIGDLPDGAVPFSHTNPTIHITGTNFVADAQQDLPGVMKGQFQVSGTLGSAMCDRTPGDRGQISVVRGYVNRVEVPFAEIPVAVTKGANGPLGRPYPFSGTFNATVPVTLFAGPNEIIIEAQEPVLGRVGIARIAIDVRAKAVGDKPSPSGIPQLADPFTVEVDFSGLSLPDIASAQVGVPVMVRDRHDETAPEITESLRQYGVAKLSLKGERIGFQVPEANLQQALTGLVDEFTATIDVPEYTAIRRTMIFRRISGSRFATISPLVVLTKLPEGGFQVQIQIGGDQVGGIVDPQPGGSYASDDGNIEVRVEEHDAPLGTPVALTADVTVASLGLDAVPVDLEEREAGGGVFDSEAVTPATIDSEEEEVSPEDYLVDYPEVLSEDATEDYHPLVVQINGPDELLDDPDFRVETYAGPLRIEESAQGERFLATASPEGGIDSVVLLPQTDLQGSSLGARSDDVPDLPDIGPENPILRSADFFRGTLAGMSDGVGGLVSATGQLIGEIWLQAGLGLLSLAPGELGNQAEDIAVARLEAAVEVASALVELANSIMQEYQVRRDEIIAAALSGDMDQMRGIAEEYKAIFELGYELLLVARDAYSDLHPFEQGRIFGGVLFEVASMAAGYAKMGKIATVSKWLAMQKANGFIRHKLTQGGVNASRWARALSGTAKQRLARVLEIAGVWLGRFRTTQMCFIAGTPVATPQGWKNIEEIVPGDIVWSRQSEFAPVVARPVVATFVTNPDQLHRISYRSGGSACAEAAQGEILSTGEHPFYVIDSQSFVDASCLRPGMKVSLLSGGFSVVTGNDIECAPTGSTFTTYNFEVSDTHTYFVGLDAVWVHNEGGRECSRILAIYLKLRSKDGLTPWDAMGKLRRMLPNASSKALSRAWGEAMNELPRGIKFMGGDLSDPLGGVWRTKSGLQYGPNAEILPNGSRADNRVQHVLYHSVDDPARIVGPDNNPFPHGVFDAGPEGTLDEIDEAWERVASLGLQPINGAYTVPMGRRIGFEGGVAGGQTGNRACEFIKLVVRNEAMADGLRVANVITAYPVRIP